ncbi:unnamed protein product [Prorocentrum cordatum]|uniref:Uncharacterized protein n=1 Tax=Prorocentrum cordatum TaxID=2364126 RepID=A0ABN9U2U4_9DINO|nr:unnamed protein product [Polarella glacialis]
MSGASAPVVSAAQGAAGDASGSGGSSMANLCCSCSKPLGDNGVLVFRAGHKKADAGVFRCRVCHNLKSRMGHMFTKGLLDRSRFNAVGVDQRTSILEGAKHLYGDKLKLYIEESLERISETSETSLFKGTGVFKDESELETMFKDKPNVLAAIYRNARTITCATTERKLWELPTYETVHVHKEQTTEIRKRKVHNESTAKAAKQPKTKPEDGPNDPAGPPKDQKQLTASDTKRLNAAVDKVQKEKLAFGGLVANVKAPEMSDYISARTLQAAIDAETTLEQLEKTLGMALTAETVAKGFVKDACAEVASALEECKRLKPRVQGALGEKAEEEGEPEEEQQEVPASEGDTMVA